MGGVETARLLLNVQARQCELFGGADGALGRYYMGHVSGVFAEIKFWNPETARHFEYARRGAYLYRRRFTLPMSVQLSERLPNIAFWPDNPRIDDPTHNSGFLSGLFLPLSVRPFARMLIGEAILRNEVMERRQYRAHIRNLITDFGGFAYWGGEIVRQRFLYGRRIPRWFVMHPSGRYRLHFIAEHRPCVHNCVRLSDKSDDLGVRRVAVHFGVSDEDVGGVVEAHRVLDRYLQSAGIGELIYCCSPEDIRERSGILPDGLHQIGLTRIGANKSLAVADGNCLVFGFHNLFIAGSAAFPTSGQANPTFPAIALAIRLADHLQRQQRTRPVTLLEPREVSSNRKGHQPQPERLVDQAPRFDSIGATV